MSSQSLSSENIASVTENNGSSSGVLNCWVKQTSSSTPSDNGSIHYTEVWKGSYKTGKDILSKIASGMNIDAVHQLLGDNRMEVFDVPQVPIRGNLNGTWIVESIDVSLLDAGQHCLLTIQCFARYGATAGESTSLINDSTNDTWNLSWLSYTVTPYAFCKNNEHDDKPFSTSNTVEAFTSEDWSKSASRIHIDTYRNNNPQVFTDGDNTAFVYTPDQRVPECRKVLSPAEGEVYKKIALERNAVYHYPIIVHTSTFVSNDKTVSFFDVVGEDMDTKLDDLPSGCPYYFLDNTWEWMKIGEDITLAKTNAKTNGVKTYGVTYTRKITYAGYKGIDVNYYGEEICPKDNHSETLVKECRWLIEGI